MIVALAGGVGSARFLAGLLQVVDPARRRHRGQHGRRRLVPRAAGLPRPRLGHLRPRRRQQPRDRLGPRRARRSRPSARSSATGCPRGSTSATGTSRPTSTARERLRAGDPLSAITADIAAAWGLSCRLLPMTDDDVGTRITAAMPDGPVELALEEWFVKEHCEPPVVSVRFDGAESARPAPGVLEALRESDTIVICPANPIAVDRTDPRGPRDPRDGRRASACRRDQQPDRGRGGARPSRSHCSPTSASRRRASASPRLPRLCARRSSSTSKTPVAPTRSKRSACAQSSPTR